MLLGSHVSMSGKKMLLASVEEAISYGATTFMVYTGAPQNTRRKAIEELSIPAAKQLMAEHNIEELVVHTPYIINLGNVTNLEHFDFAIHFLRNEIIRAEAMGAKQITMHPGAHVGAGSELAIKNIIKGLNEVLDKDQIPQIALETMAGKGTEIGRTFYELADIMSGVTLNDKLSVTLDTCHTHDAGYLIKEDFDAVLVEFDKIIGLDKLKVIHINDSKNDLGAGKDRHENIGFGKIGFDSLNYIAHHPALTQLPKIMETPWVPIEEKSKIKVAPYKMEIAMIKEQVFNPNLKQELIG